MSSRPKHQDSEIDPNIHNESECKAPDWLPNWRNPKDYPPPKNDNVTLVQRGWMWEFIRRNPNYQNDFYELIKNHEFLEMCSNTRLEGNTYKIGAFIFIKKEEALAIDTTDDAASKKY